MSYKDEMPRKRRDFTCGHRAKSNATYWRKNQLCPSCEADSRIMRVFQGVIVWHGAAHRSGFGAIGAELADIARINYKTQILRSATLRGRKYTPEELQVLEAQVRLGGAASSVRTQDWKY